MLQDFGDSRRSRVSRVVAVVAIVVVGLSRGAATTSLVSRVEVAERHHVAAAESLVLLRTIDGIEWRAQAGQPIEPLKAEFAEAAARLADMATSGAITSPDVAGDLRSYARAVAAQLDAVGRGDLAEAARLDEELVDPTFERTLDKVAEYMVEERTEQASAVRNLRLLIWIGSIVLTLGAATLALFAMTVLRRSRLRRITSTVDRRFRSLVQSSAEVIMLLAEDGTVTLMSPTLGDLRDFTHPGGAPTAAALFEGQTIDRWLVADQTLRATGTAQRVEVTLKGRDGDRVFEVRGSRLIDSGDLSVWVWHNIDERKQFELELARQAFHDALTGLPNRALFQDRTDRALIKSERTSRPTTVLFCDVDDFKTINDSLGHAAGDELLRIIADRLVGCIRQSDVLARFGGDEFVILLEEHDLARSWVVADRILEVVAKEVLLRDRTVRPSISIGVATAAPGSNTEELLRNADTALYAAKRNGKGRAQSYSPEMTESMAEMIEYQTDMERALERGEFSLQYQPTVNLVDGSVEGVEALLRWHHPTRGFVSPATFIPLAEATGLIIPIGRWVLQEAMRTAAMLQEGRSTPLTMHVNLSPRQLHDHSIVDFTKALLEQTGLLPSLLVLEVTEGILLDDHTAVQQLHRLRNLGPLVAIDDFGTGYTSINYLQHLPVDILKIDRSFVSGGGFEPTERGAFLRAIVSLGKSLGLHTVAEGIETMAQLDELCDIGCEAGQGFFWSPAVSSNVLQSTIDVISRPALAPAPTPIVIGT